MTVVTQLYLGKSLKTTTGFVHAGILGNEKADKLAKEAARTRLIDITLTSH
jgi:ribonuclease HI